MMRSRRGPLCWGSFIGLLLCLCVQGNASAQGESPRPSRRGGGASPAQGNAAPAPGPALPAVLSANAKITLNQGGLSVEVQDQDLAAVIERIASLGRIEVNHAESIPNRRVSIRFASLPVAEGLRRLFRATDVPGYLLMMAKQDGRDAVQRIVFLPDEGAPGAGRLTQRVPPPRPTGPPPGVSIPPPPPPAPSPPQEENKAEDGRSGGTVFDEIKSNAAARRLLSQMMHPNDQVRERAFEGLVRLVREDDKQRALMELLEPLMEDLASEDKATQDDAREEIRKLLSR